MAEDDLSKHSPYELGETGDARAVPYLLRYLYRGSPNERCLAASAVGKLARKHREACAVAAVALLDCLDDPAPQVRQYALSALKHLPLPPEAATRLIAIRDGDEQPYNRDAAAAILQSIAALDSHQQAPALDQEPQVDDPLGSVETIAPPTVVTPPTPAPTTITLAILHRFLEVAYGEPRRLSELLCAAGIPDDAIATLRREHLSTYLSLLMQRLCAWIMHAFEGRTADIFIRRFELD